LRSFDPATLVLDEDKDALPLLVTMSEMLLITGASPLRGSFVRTRCLSRFAISASSESTAMQ
jgi:hypothetical protein